MFWGEDAKSGQVSAVASCLGTITNCAYTSLSTNFTGTTTNSVDLAVTSTGLFADPANNLWSLITASPLIDSGTATGAPANDLIGTVRPQGTTIDVGAYEYTNATSLSELSNLNYKIINGNLIIKGLERNEIVNVYNVTGSKILSLKSDGNEIIAPISNGVYIISIKSRNIKVLVNK